jgi:uncharacterized RDD family membrane protein YckC
MNCPVGGDAAAQINDPCIAGGAAAASDVAVGADFELDGEYWRREVAARLQRYRARRKPRGPRYPSLRLPFDSADAWMPASAPSPALSAGMGVASALAAEPVFEIEERSEETIHSSAVRPRIVEEPEPFNNVIEFPRSAAVPVSRSDELAEPVWDRPRIVEAPEVLPPPPALGGMLIEAAANREAESSANDLPLPAAALTRRLLAGVLDALVLATALAAFGAIFLWVNGQRPAVPVAIAAGAIVWAGLWAAYEFLFLVYTGSTPGLRLAGLRLTGFDGSPVTRSRRRWRVLASYLSALSLGLGYLWCILDEDGLSWHYRMTRTHFS